MLFVERLKEYGFSVVYMSLHPMAASNIWEPRAKMSIESFQWPRTLIEVGLGVNPNTRVQFCSKHHVERQMSKHWTAASGGHRALVPWWEPVVTSLSSTDRHITLVCVCFCKDALFNVYHWFLTVNSAKSARLRREGSLFNTHVFSVRHITAFLHLVIPDTVSALRWGPS